jgi:hypothetical protein
MVDSGIYGPNGPWDKAMQEKHMRRGGGGGSGGDGDGDGCRGCLWLIVGGMVIAGLTRLAIFIYHHFFLSLF